MKDYITDKIETYIRYKNYSFYKIKKKLKETGINLDKLVLLKRIKNL